MNCNETLLDVITSIEAYPFSVDSNIKDMSVHSKRVSETELSSLSSMKMIVPMKPKSCTYSEKSSLSLPGDSYEVTVNWQVQKCNESEYEILESLYNNPNHLIIRAYGGGALFVRCEEHGYNFTYSEKDGLIDCELTIHNKSGIQRVI